MLIIKAYRESGIVNNTATTVEGKTDTGTQNWHIK